MRAATAQASISASEPGLESQQGGGVGWDQRPRQPVADKQITERQPEPHARWRQRGGAPTVAASRAPRPRLRSAIARWERRCEQSADVDDGEPLEDEHAEWRVQEGPGPAWKRTRPTVYRSGIRSAHATVGSGGRRDALGGDGGDLAPCRRQSTTRASTKRSRWRGGATVRPARVSTRRIGCRWGAAAHRLCGCGVAVPPRRDCRPAAGRGGRPQFRSATGDRHAADGGGPLDVRVEMTFHPQNTYIGVPDYEVFPVGRTGIGA